MDREERLEELSRHQKAIRDAAELADRPTIQAMSLISEARGLLSSGGLATARIQLRRAVDRLMDAMSHLPES